MTPIIITRISCRELLYVIKTTTLILLLLTNSAYAYLCKNITTGAEMQNGTSSVSVPLSRNITIGQVVYFDLSKSFQCKNEKPDENSDYMYIQSDGYSSGLPSAFETGVNINGVDYKTPVPYTKVINLPQGNDSSYHALRLYGYYKLGEDPGKGVHIHAGDVIATLNLYKYAVRRGDKVDEKYFTWNILAANDSFLTSGSCDINGGKPLEINFGSMRSKDIRSGRTNELTKTVNFTYKCKNPINTSVKMTLLADSASFSNEAIVLSNKKLGIIMSYKGKIIAPYEGYNTMLSLGQGNDEVSFSLVKMDGSLIEPGVFSGSATLVMSID